MSNHVITPVVLCDNLFRMVVEIVDNLAHFGKTSRSIGQVMKMTIIQNASSVNKGVYTA